MYAIELTPSNIHIIQAGTGKNSVKVKQAFSAPMPQGSYFNGYIKDFTSIGKAIRDMLLNHNITKGDVRFVLDSSAIKTKEVVVPNERRLNILSILNKEMSDILASEPHVLDYAVYGSYNENRKRYLNCMLYALPKEIITEFIKLSEECGLQIKGLDYHYNVLSKLWELEEPGIKRSVLQSQEGIHVNQKLQLRIGLYQDSIRIAANAVDGNCYSRTVPYGEMLQEIMFMETESKKQQMMFFIDQILLFLQFVATANTQQRLEEILIYGDFEEIDEVTAALLQQVSCKVKMLMPPKNISGIAEKDYAVYCNAIGAMLRR